MKAVKLFKVSEPIEDILSRPSGKLVGLLGFFGSLIIIPLLLLIILLGVVGIFIGSRGGYSVIDRVESRTIFIKPLFTEFLTVTITSGSTKLASSIVLGST